MAKFFGALKEVFEQAKQRDSYWVEEAKLQFAIALERQRRSAGMTYKAVADKLGTSAAYITKVFRGDANVTIESMVKLARATGGHVEVRIVDSKTAANWDFATLQVKALVKQTASTAESETVVTQSAGNDERFALAA